MDYQISDSVTKRQDTKESSATHEPPAHPSKEDAPSKKRKRKDVDPSDPKLLEYLNVMKPGGSGLIETEINANTGADFAENAAALVPEGESDDEYEKIPARKEKQPRLEPPLKEQEPVPTQAEPAKAHVSAEDSPEVTSANEGLSKEGMAQAATDDDWLRSRTNRLLDLVDAGDLPAPATANTERVSPSKHQESSSEPLQTATEVADVAADEVGDEAETTAPEGDGSPEDVIRRTARLFIRNLPYTSTEDDLRGELEKFGPVEEVRKHAISFNLALRGDGTQHDETQIGTAYTTVSDENPGRLF